MKKIYFVLSLLTLTSLLTAQQTGIFQTYIFVNQNGNGNTTYEGSIQNSNNARLGNFSGQNFSDPTSLILDGIQAHTYKNNGGDVTGGTFYYRVYEQNAMAPAYSSASINFNENCPGTQFTGTPGGQCNTGGDQRWITGSISANLLSGITVNGTYNIDIYIEISTNLGNRNDGTSGMPLTATMTITSLPVELTHFSAEKSINQSDLSWATASETNNSHFDLQRSADSRQWQTIGTVTGHGNSLEVQEYQYTDRQPLPGMNYYRLKQVDFDGRFEYSRVVSVAFGPDGSKPSLSPNPAGSELNFSLPEEDKEAPLRAIVYDRAGKACLQAPLTGNTLDIGGLPPGVYFVQLVDDSRRVLVQERFIKY